MTAFPALMYQLNRYPATFDAVQKEAASLALRPPIVRFAGEWTPSEGQLQWITNERTGPLERESPTC